MVSDVEHLMYNLSVPVCRDIWRSGHVILSVFLRLCFAIPVSTSPRHNAPLTGTYSTKLSALKFVLKTSNVFAGVAVVNVVVVKASSIIYCCCCRP